jgi:hypothetical protein
MRALSKTLGQNKNTKVAIGSLLFGLMSSLIFLPYYGNNIVFGQTVDKIGLELNSSNSNNGSDTGTSGTSQIPVSQQIPPGFVAKGTINSIVSVPAGKWLATGNWSMILNNGNVSLFNTNMTWYNSSGTNAHTHELTNFKPAVGEQVVSLEQPTNSIVIKGFTDAGTNNQKSWSEVPTTIVINARKIISISVDDNKTNRHFGGQPILGVVSSFVPCSDLPGANMEVLPPCTISTGLEDALILTNNTISEDAPGIEGQFPSEDAPGVEEQFPSEDTPGVEGQSSLPSEDAPGVEGQSSLPSEDAPGVDGSFLLQNKTECIDLDIKNVSSSGFETDPSDYHPPGDAIDADSATWWSNQDENSWLQIDLGSSNMICGLSVEWNKGDTREYSFEIGVSGDGNNFEKVFQGSNKVGSLSLETYPIEKLEGKYIKLTTTGTSSDAGWVSIKEMKATGHPVS